MRFYLGNAQSLSFVSSCDGSFTLSSPSVGHYDLIARDRTAKRRKRPDIFAVERHAMIVFSKLAVKVLRLLIRVKNIRPRGDFLCSFCVFGIRRVSLIVKDSSYIENTPSPRAPPFFRKLRVYPCCQGLFHICNLHIGREEIRLCASRMIDLNEAHKLKRILSDRRKG